MISKKTYFSKEGSRGGGDECKNDGFRASEFHGAVRERVFSFCLAPGGSPWIGQGSRHGK